MTPELAVATIIGMTPLREPDVLAIIAVARENPAGLPALIKTYGDAAAINERSPWQKFLDVVKQVAEFATIVQPIEQAIAGLFPIAAGVAAL